MAVVPRWAWDAACQLLADGYSVERVAEVTGFPVEQLLRRARIRKIQVRTDAQSSER